MMYGQIDVEVAFYQTNRTMFKAIVKNRLDPKSYNKNFSKDKGLEMGLICILKWPPPWC